MNNSYTIKPIAYIHNDFSEKFGIPRQSGLVNTVKSSIVFEKMYRNPDAFRGLEGFSHIWLIWGFSESVREGWSPTVRPPRLGGNKRAGVFATRSPFRPNSMGLSSVELERISMDKELGPVLHVLGADLMDGTPVFDIKPYLPYVDSHPDALDGFAGPVKKHRLHVKCPDYLMSLIPTDCRNALCELLSQDPRPSYQEDAGRIYGMKYAGLNIKFRVEKDTAIILQVEPSVK